jgi:cytochrome b subunit of formate dehydrogenase
MGKALAGRTVDIIPPAAAPPWKIGDITMNYHELIQFDSGAEIVRQDSAAPEPTHLLAARLVQKSPEQAALVREHLSRFAKFYGGMSERMEEFVSLFPIHPDSIAVLERISFVKPTDILQWLSDEVKRLLEEPIPANGPGLIGYDRFWEYLRRQPEFQKVSEVEAVVYCSKTVTAAFEKSWTRPEWKPTARRLLQALLVHRLITGDIYNQHGATPVELRDALCLPPPGVENSGGEPAEVLMSSVVEILGELRKVAGEKSIFFHPHTHQYGVHIQKFKRFVKPELILHWVNGLPFLVMMLTGVVMLASRFWHLDRGMFVIVHEVFAAAWVIGLPLTVLVHAKIHWQHIRIVLTWGRDDLLWMTQSFRSVYNKNITPPPAARFNTGQKINALLVFVYFFGFSATGVLMFFKGSILFPWYVHTALFFSAMGSVGGHLHLALLNPSTRLRRLAFFTAGRPSNTSGIITR